MKFIHPDNQKILWNKLSNTAYFNESTFSLEEKQIWFKKIIQQFYEKYRYAHLGTNEIKNLNRAVILYMINELNSINKFEKNNVYISPELSTNDSSALFSKDSSALFSNDLKRNIENKNANEFQERQKEYENMLKVKTPSDINFSEKIEDDVITNMEELVKQHMLQREMDIEPIKNIPVNGKPQVNGEPKKITDINDFFSILQKPKESSEKHIQWSNNLEESHFIDIQSERVISPEISPRLSPPLSENLRTNQMEKEMNNMREEISILREMVESLTNEIKSLRETIREPEPVFFEMSDH